MSERYGMIPIPRDYVRRVLHLPEWMELVCVRDGDDDTFEFVVTGNYCPVRQEGEPIKTLMPVLRDQNGMTVLVEIQGLDT